MRRRLGGRGSAREVEEPSRSSGLLNLMRLASWAAIAALTTLLAGSAEAMPTPAPYHAESEITLAADGCGYYWHRNVYGACVRNGPAWGGVVVAPGYYGGYGAPGYWHGGYYHGGGVSYHYHYHYNYHYNYSTSYHTGGWHGGGWHGGGGHWHGGGGHWHGGGHRR
jgi:hypothetical protein